MSELKETSIIFKALSDDLRVKILELLYKSDSYIELLAEKLEVQPATISYHIKKLEEAGFVKSSRI